MRFLTYISGHFRLVTLIAFSVFLVFRCLVLSHVRKCLDSRNKSQTNLGNCEMSGQKHLRLRYYTSLEEALVVKLWREHLPDIPSYTDNLPIFREIAFGLQQHGIRLNKQEVRRRINSYRNRYL